MTGPALANNRGKEGVADRGSEEHGVGEVERTTDAWDELARVLHLRFAFDRALKEICRHRGNREGDSDQASGEGAQAIRKEAGEEGNGARADNAGTDDAADGTFSSFIWAEVGRKGGFPNCHTSEECADVGEF